MHPERGFLMNPAKSDWKKLLEEILFERIYNLIRNKAKREKNINKEAKT